MTKEQTMDVRNISVPVLLVVSIVAFFVWATSFMMNERHTLHESFRLEIRRLEDRILSIDNDLKRLHSSIIRFNSQNSNATESRDAVFASVCELLKKDNPSLRCDVGVSSTKTTRK